MHGVRIPVIAATLSILLLGAPTGAIEKCDLVADYMLEHEADPQFGISIYQCADLWRLDLEKFRGRSASGKARWSVLDSVQLPDVAPDEVVVSETCGIGDSPDKGIVAIGRQTDEPEFSRIRAAWRADKERARWISVDAATVHCWNEAAGFS